MSSFSDINQHKAFYDGIKNLYDEVEQVAKDIIHLVRDKKARYKDIASLEFEFYTKGHVVNAILPEIYGIDNNGKEIKDNK